jgi:hypothetical protein
MIVALRRDWPAQYEITALRLAATIQTQRIADLERALTEAMEVRCECG